MSVSRGEASAIVVACSGSNLYVLSCPGNTPRIPLHLEAGSAWVSQTLPPAAPGWAVTRAPDDYTEMQNPEVSSRCAPLQVTLVCLVAATAERQHNSAPPGQPTLNVNSYVCKPPPGTRNRFARHCECVHACEIQLHDPLFEEIWYFHTQYSRTDTRNVCLLTESSQRRSRNGRMQTRRGSSGVANSTATS